MAVMQGVRWTDAWHPVPQQWIRFAEGGGGGGGGGGGWGENRNKTTAGSPSIYKRTVIQEKKIYMTVNAGNQIIVKHMAMMYGIRIDANT